MPTLTPDHGDPNDTSDPLHNENVGIRLAQARIAYKQSQRTWAKTIGVKPNQVSQWEAGQFVPGRWRLLKYKSVVGVTSDWLLFGDRGGMPPALLHALDAALLDVGHEKWQRDRP